MSAREARREVARGAGIDQAGQSKRGDRLRLGAGVHSVEANHLPELESFARSIQHDKAAVLAGLTLPWSTSLLS